MKLKTRDTFATPESRQRFAYFLSATIEGRYDTSFRPYKPNDSDDTFWTLDSANNWKVQFEIAEPSCFRIRYRYNCDSNRFEQALAAWLVVRMGAEIVTR